MPKNKTISYFIVCSPLCFRFPFSFFHIYPNISNVNKRPYPQTTTSYSRHDPYKVFALNRASNCCRATEKSTGVCTLYITQSWLSVFLYFTSRELKQECNRLNIPIQNIPFVHMTENLWMYKVTIQQLNYKRASSLCPKESYMLEQFLGEKINFPGVSAACLGNSWWQKDTFNL